MGNFFKLNYHSYHNVKPYHTNTNIATGYFVVSCLNITKDEETKPTSTDNEMSEIVSSDQYLTAKVFFKDMP